MLTGLKTIRAYGREEKIPKIPAEKRPGRGRIFDADYYGSLIGPAVNFVNNLGTVLISTAGAFSFSLSLSQ